MSINPSSPVSEDINWAADNEPIGLPELEESPEPISSPELLPSSPTSTAGESTAPASCSTTLSIEYEDGDVILRTDDTDFRVHTAILRQASPFFRSLFTLPQPPSTDEIPIISMEEDAQVLHTLIRIIYPVRRKLSVDNFEFAQRLLRAADKLEIECAIDPIRESISRLLENEPNPIRAWALAKHLGDEAAEKAAVLRYLKCQTVPRERVTELSYVNGLDYSDLTKKRGYALHGARIAIETTVWGCSRCGKVPAWKHEHCSMIAGLNPFSSDVASDHLFELSARRTGCTSCVDSVCGRINPYSTFKSTPASLRARLDEILSTYSS